MTMDATFKPPPAQQSRLRVALLRGSDTASTDVQSGVMRVKLKGNNDYWRIVALDRFEVTRFQLAPNYFRTPRRWDFSQFDVVLNTITDPDQNPKTIKVVERITRGFDHVVNRPEVLQTTTRSEVAKRLESTPKLVVPKVIRLRYPTLERLRARVAEHAFRFPAILRQAGMHTGKIIGVVDRAEDLDPVFGDRKHEYFLTEFVNFASADGLYRKMRVFFIGNEVLFKHLIVSSQWNVHAKDRADIMAGRDDLRREEQQLVEGGFTTFRVGIDDCLREIKSRIKLDYFGMDCALLADGRLVLFELNATMNFFPLSPDPRFAYLQAGVEPAKEAMSRLLASRARSTTPNKPAPMP